MEQCAYLTVDCVYWRPAGVFSRQWSCFVWSHRGRTHGPWDYSRATE